jgi:hypothetical protein
MSPRQQHAKVAIRRACSSASDESFLSSLRLEIHFRSFLNVSKNPLKDVATVLSARRAHDGLVVYFA